MSSFKGFVGIFKESVTAFGENTAVVYQSKKISYSELDSLVENMASNLLLKGLRKGDVVALSMFNCHEMVACILAIWQLGGVLVLVDPNYPQGKKLNMLQDAKPKLLLTVSGATDTRPVDNILTVNIEEFAPTKNIAKNINIQGCDSAYIIYTSGTTGNPKGIEVNHKALLHATLAYTELHPFASKCLVAGSISFDPSLLTLVFALSMGGSLCFYENKDGVDPDSYKEIADLIVTESLDFILSTPSFYSKILSLGMKFPSLLNVDLCGEAVVDSLVDQHIDRAPAAFLFNVYGPTEYAMGATAALLYSPRTKLKSDISIGKEFSCNRVFLLDYDCNPVKPGTKGEIYIGGPGLAAGYLNLEALTQEKFIWINFSEKNPIRVYKTGDFGMMTLSGDIIFCGRLDSQVKINGHRVELEEIEKLIDSFPFVNKSVVVSVTTKHSSKNVIVAYFQRGKKSCSKQRIQKEINNRLPPYMHPSELVEVNQFPITENGKIDRKRLGSGISF